MFNITLITMGKLKEKFYLSAAAEYSKRLSGYCSFQLLELPEHRLPDNPSPAEIQAGLEKEAELILSKIPKGAWFCVFTPEGKELSSEDFAQKLKDVKLIPSNLQLLDQRKDCLSRIEILWDQCLSGNLDTKSIVDLSNQCHNIERVQQTAID